MDTEGLSVICAGLGIVEEDDNGNRIGYSKGEYCLDNLKDLLRFLRRDDPQTREVFKQVCKWNIVSKDLIPIIEHCQDDRTLVLNSVKVLVFITMPIEPTSTDIPQQIEYLWGLKSAITCSDTVAVIVSLLEVPLENLEREVLTEDDWKLVQLVLTLFRNILAIQDIPLQQKAGGSASQYLSLRDRCLEHLFNENVMDIIIVITQHVGGSCGYFRQDNLLLLESYHYIFMGQDPELTAKAPLKGSTMSGDSKDSVDSLKSIIVEEQEKRKLSRLSNVARHSQFSGMFTRLTVDGSKAVLNGNPMLASRNGLVKPDKGHKGISKKIVWDHGRLPSTNDNVLQLLHDFLNQFLSGSYNVLMQSIRDDIEKEDQAIQSCDIVSFLRVAQFVTSFQYHKSLSSEPAIQIESSEASKDGYADSTLFRGNICGPIASSMNESMFQLVISKWRTAFDDLKETHNYKLLSAAGSLMKTMIRMLDLVLKLLPDDSKESHTARILLYKLFYDQTDQGMTQFLLNQIKAFDNHKQPKSDLADLVEMIYVLVRLMEHLQARGTLRVSRKARKARKKKVLNDSKEAEPEISGSHANLQHEVCNLNGECQAELAMPEKDGIRAATDGNRDIDTSCQGDETETSVPETRNTDANLRQVDHRKSDHADEYLSCSTSDSSGDEQQPAANEVDFNVSTFISAFANSSIIQNLCWLLKFYKSNSVRTNHYLICMLRRITDDLELAPMLYQLSRLVSFYDILAEQKSCPCKDYANIVDFLTRLVRKMFKKMKSQPLLFVEILFWKTRKECHYINAEYLLHELGHLRTDKGNSEDGPETGEYGLSKANGWAPRSIADALGDDEADVVISHDLGYQNEMQEGRQSVFNNEIDPKEKLDNGINSRDDSEKVTKRKRRLVLGDDWDMKIKDLYDKFKDDRHCTRLIAEHLAPEGKISAAQVSNKLKQLGFAVGPRKRVRHYGEPSADFVQPGEQVRLEERDVALSNSDGTEGSSLKQPLNTRKRVHALSKDQENAIKVLFEQFKDHKRCSYLIANALDAGITLTAAQVSRKLKQLGLRPLRHKKTAASVHLKDDLNVSFFNESLDSDTETLSTLRKRNKRRQGGGLGEESQEKIIEGNLSDDETLSTVIKKSRKLLSKPNDDGLASTLIKVTNEDVRERDGSNKFGGTDVAEGEDIRFNDGSLEQTSETELTFSHMSAVSTVNKVDDSPKELMEDDLADSGDDLATGELVTSSRRKLRRVVDFEDDD